jgi:hypothetical protein
MGKRGAEWQVRVYDNLDAMKAEEMLEWQALPAHERLQAVSEISLELYRWKGAVTDVPRLQRTLVHLPFPEG